MGVEASAKRGENRREEEEDQAGGGGDSDERNGDAHEQSDRAKQFENAEGSEPALTDAELVHGGKDPCRTSEVVCGGVHVGCGSEDGDGEINGRHERNLLMAQREFPGSDDHVAGGPTIWRVRAEARDARATEV